MVALNTSSISSAATLTISCPTDCHLHLRDGDILIEVLPHTARQFIRAVIMPNLIPPVTTTEQALAYRNRILSAIPSGILFEPLMTLYLTDNTQPDEIIRASESGFVYGIKFYPSSESLINSNTGVTNLNKCSKTLEKIQDIGIPLLVHGEFNDISIDIFDREKAFIDRIMTPLRQNFPCLKIVFEHITTKDAVDYVLDSSSRGLLGATITAHHLLYNRNSIFVGGIRPHYYCSPVLKREIHRIALVEAAISGNPRFFLGTDSAPHARDTKESSCGYAGCYTALHAMELYAEAFDQASALDRLEGFASFYGADFYGLQRCTKTITLQRESWTLPEEIIIGNKKVVPLRSGESVKWKLI
ncbi:MAG: dihydroorotase [Burkholderia sp.]|nr:dihydroorotase [Burkholderia sp.]